MIPLDRKEKIQARSAITGLLRKEKEKQIAQKLQPYIQGKVAAYQPISGEVNILEYFSGFCFYFPHTSKTDLTFYHDTQEKIKGAFGVEEPLPTHKIEPKDLDVIIVPVVGFQGCKRIGYGAGYYDRYLKETQALKIGIAFDCQEMDEIIWHEGDVELDRMITESRIIEREER